MTHLAKRLDEKSDEVKMFLLSITVSIVGLSLSTPCQKKNKLQHV